MRYQKIESQIWHDEKFIKLSHSQQLLFFYILTSPHNNLIGTYVLKQGYICEDMKIKSIKKDIDKLIKVGLIRYDYETGLIHIPNFFKHNPLTNPNQHKSAVKVWNRLPKSSLLLEVYEGLSEGLKQRLGEGLSKPEEEVEEETEVGTGTEVEEKIGRITPEELVEAWNNICGTEGFPKVNKIPADRRQKINARLKAHPEVEFWTEVLNRIARTPFLKGNNDREWKANIDWLISNDTNAVKVTEGFYAKSNR